MSDIHQLLKESIDKIAGQWVEQLTVMRSNATLLEQQVMTCVAKTKADITQLHDLGVKVAEEAQRGVELCAKLSESVERITGEAVTTAEAAE